MKIAVLVDRVTERAAAGSHGGISFWRGPEQRPFGGKPLAALLVPLLAGCSGPLSTLTPQGPAARQIALLWWAMFGGAALLTMLVLVLVWLGFRPRKRAAPGERFWVHTMGIWFSLAILTAVVAGGIVVGERLQPRPAPEVVRVEAIARQWNWRFRQPGPDGATVETEGRLHIPAGTPVDVVIRSEDVIHSFWVPQLAGKLDAIPGRETVLRIEADTPGIYHGRSAEFSGIGYTGMVFELLAYPPGEPPAFTDLTGGSQ